MYQSKNWSLHFLKYQSLTLIIPPLVFDSEIPGPKPAGSRLRGPTASVHINTIAYHIVVYKCLIFKQYLLLHWKNSTPHFRYHSCRIEHSYIHCFSTLLQFCGKDSFAGLSFHLDCSESEAVKRAAS